VRPGDFAYKPAMLGTVPIESRVNVVRLNVADAGQGVNESLPLLAEESSNSTRKPALVPIVHEQEQSAMSFSA
jgi:hypothetical protein